MDTIVISVVALFGLVMLFFLLREVFCWYYKINERIQLSQRQNILLENILQHLSVETPVNKIDNYNNSVNSQDGINSSILPQDIFANLSEQEKEEADKFIRYGLKSGDKLVINKKNREIIRFDENEWGRILKNLTQNDWAIIMQN